MPWLAEVGSAMARLGLIAGICAGATMAACADAPRPATGGDISAGVDVDEIAGDAADASLAADGDGDGANDGDNGDTEDSADSDEDGGRAGPDGTPCDDGRVCTIDDRWLNGLCQPGPNQCPCEPGFVACAPPLEGDAINLCRGPQVCQPQPPGSALAFLCVASAGQHKVCDASLDGTCSKNACRPADGTCALTAVERTKELCDLPGGGCRREALAVGLPDAPTTACDDGVPCTKGDGCHGGDCQGDPAACGCQKHADCVDDGDLCNGTPYCDTSSGVGVCKLNPATVVACDTSGDGACTFTACQAKLGACKKGPRPAGTACDDSVACTEGDVCDGAGACASGTWVCCKADADCPDDGDVCNGVPFCNLSTGACKLNPASVISCPSGDDTACLQAQCDKATGACPLKPVQEGVACDDGSLCTAGEVCQQGSCGGGKDICSCGKDADCASKEDGDLCNGTYYCNLADKACHLNPASVINCPTGLDTTCQKTVCTPATGVCGKKPTQAGIVCEADGTACTAGDHCDGAGACKVGTAVCACEDDGDCLGQEDGDLCNGTLFCDKSAVAAGGKPACQVNPATLVSCPTVDDGPCRRNTCQKATGACKMVPFQKNTVCKDGDPCTGDDRCDGLGACKGGVKLTCGCALNADCKLFDDGDVCNGGYVCAGGSCVFDGKALTCDDGNPCTADSCDKLTGCKLAPVAACTFCQADAGCDDGNACTFDLCIGKKCLWQAAPAICDDGDLCTAPDLCAGTVCKAGKDVSCNDGAACTEDSCDGGKGCVYLPSPATKTADCYEGPPATLGVGACKAGSRACDGKGGSGACSGQVLPGEGDDCGGGDQDCDGKTDEDCTAAAQIIFACGEGQSAVPGEQLFESVVAQVLDPGGNPVPNVKLGWSVDAGQLAFSASTTNALGMSTNTLTLAKGSVAKDHTLTVTVDGKLVSATLVAKADPTMPKMLFHYIGFCDAASLQAKNGALFEPGRIQLSEKADSKGGVVWYAKPLVAETSFALRAETSGFAASWGVVLQAHADGLAAKTGGYADGDTVALKPAVGVRVTPAKGGNAAAPARLVLVADGAELAALDGALAAGKNDDPAVLHVDYDAATQTLSASLTAPAEPKPAKAMVEVKHDLWATLGASAKPVYLGVSAGNASAGVIGDKYLDAWSFAYLDPPCFTGQASCDDDNPCTNDICDKKAGCVSIAADGKACDDGDACTSADVCAQKVCVGGKGVPCDDGNVCTNDGCDKGKGCVTQAKAGACGDGDVCKGLGNCEGGVCKIASGLDCDDKHPCTKDACDPKSGCIHTADSALCDDGNPCTADACLVGAGCKSEAIPAGFSVACYTGAPNTKGVGVCNSGTAICDATGKAGSCSGEIVPKAKDDCLNGDEDCDGTVDEDCTITVKMSILCGSGQSANPSTQAFLSHRVLVTNGSDTPQVGKKVLWTSPDGGSYVSASTLTDSSGIATNRFVVGPTNGVAYTGEAAVEGTGSKVTFKGTAVASALTRAIDFTSFCDPTLLQLVGIAAYDNNNLRVVTGADSQNGSAWFKTPLVKNKSFQMRVDLDGYTCGYTIALQAGNNGASQSAGGYCDNGSANLNPGLVLRIVGGNLTVHLSGATIGSKSGFTANSGARSVWIDYDHGGTKISVFDGAKGGAKPSTPGLAITKDVWFALAANGKPIYAGFTAGNSSAGNNGTKYVTGWSMLTF